jgi:hypothetical protein
MAADLGGDCCADLEERVAELEATTARKGNRKMSLTISGQVSTQLMYWNDGGSVVGTGAAGGNAAEKAHHAGSKGSDLYVVDNTNTLGGLNIAFGGSARVNPNVTAGFQVLIGLDVGARSAGADSVAFAIGTTKGVTQVDDDGGAGVPGTSGSAAADSFMVLALANWYIDHKQLGRITVGRANTATAGVSTIDLGDAGVIASANIGYWQRNMYLIQDGVLQAGQWSNALGGGTVNGSGLSRANVIVYSSPTLGGFSVGAAWGENDEWDVALRYAGEFSGFRLAAGVGYIRNTTGFGDAVADIPVNDGKARATIWKGSASVLHVASGLYLTGSFVDRDNDTAGVPNTTLWYVQGGISKNWTGLGKTVLYGEYAQVNDGINCAGAACAVFGGDPGGVDSITSSQATVLGVGIVQHIDAAAMELYLAYRRYSADVFSPNDPGADFLTGTESYSDMDVVMGGARIRF